MRSIASRGSLGAGTDALLSTAATLDDAGLRTLAGELAAVGALLRREVALRRALADSTVPAANKSALISRLLAGKVGASTGRVLDRIVTGEWSSGVDLRDALYTLSRTAMFLRAERAGELDEVEDEIFRFGRIISANPALSSVLDDPNARPQARADMVSRLLDGKAHPLTVELLTSLALDTRGRSFTHGVNQLVEEAAQRNDKAVAIVTSPVALTAAQTERLSGALAGIYGRPVAVHVEVDESIQGGLVVRVGDEVIDGSVAGRLADVRSRLAG